MNGSDVRRQRLANQGLVGARFTTPAEVVSWLGAVQSQDYAAARWGVGLRLPDATDADVERAFDEGAILRTHVLRPTWHFVASADIRWLLRLTGPRVKMLLRGNDRLLGVDGDLIRRSHAAIARALEGGRHLTRGALETALGAVGIAASGQLLGHILMHAELDGLICSGPRRGKQMTYALLEERVAPARERDADEALAELVRRYVASHGPATPRDFSWWSGLTIAEGRRGLALLGSEIVVERVDGAEYWLVPTAAPPMPAAVYLLPCYDEYTVAYRDRDLYFDPALAGDLPARNNVPFDYAIVTGGRVAGLWRRTLLTSGLAVETRPFLELDADGRAQLRAAAERYALFLGRPLVLDGQPV